MGMVIVRKRKSKRTRCFQTRLHLWEYRTHRTHRLWLSRVVRPMELQGAILYEQSTLINTGQRPTANTEAGSGKTRGRT